MKHITIAGAVLNETQLVYILATALPRDEMNHLIEITNDAVPGLLFYGRVAKRETFENNDDFVGWVRSAMEGL